MTDRRRAALRAALGFLQLPPRAPELRLLHRWLDTWTGLGLAVVGASGMGSGSPSATLPTASAPPNELPRGPSGW